MVIMHTSFSLSVRDGQKLQRMWSQAKSVSLKKGAFVLLKEKHIASHFKKNIRQLYFMSNKKERLKLPTV